MKAHRSEQARDSLFLSELHLLTVSEINRLRSEGTVAMSLDNLWAILSAAVRQLPGAPELPTVAVQALRWTCHRLPRSHRNFILDNSRDL